MSPAITPTIAVVGYLSLDDIVLAGRTARNVPGGAALYTCLGVLAAGGRPALFVRTGTDFPLEVLSELAHTGVALEGVEMGNVPSRRARLVYEGCDSRRSDHHGEAAWWQRTEALSPPAPEGDFDAMAVTPMPAAHARKILSGRPQGRSTVLDTSEAFAVRDRRSLLELLKEVDVFAPSRAETRRMLPGYDDDAAAIELTSRARTVVHKRGPDGLVLARKGEILVRWGAKPDPVVDPTGAGDAVTGALSVALARNLPPRAMLALADQVAICAVAGLGPSALGLPFRAVHDLQVRPCA